MPIKIPRHIEINKYIYSFKDELKNNFYSYRCKYRQKCKIIIKVAREEIEKYNKNDNYEIQMDISSEQKNHTCKLDNEEEVKNNQEKENNEKENLNSQKQKEIAKTIIFANLNKPFSFHYENLKTNDIYLTKNQVKRILQTLRESKYPNDNEYLKNISKINITFEKLPNMENVSLCQR